MNETEFMEAVERTKDVIADLIQEDGQSAASRAEIVALAGRIYDNLMVGYADEKGRFVMAIPHEGGGPKKPYVPTNPITREPIEDN